MNKTTLVAVALLIGTNAAWFFTRSDPTTDANGGVDALDMEQTITELQDEIAGLRRAEPVLVGTGESGTGVESRTPDTVKGAAASQDGAAAPSTPEEVAKAKEEAERKQAAEETSKAYAAARETVMAIVKKVMQVEDPGLRAEGLRELSAALEGDDPHLVEYALSSLHSLRKTEFDRAGFRGIVRQLLQSDKEGIRRSALYALHAVEKDDADPRIALQSASDPSPIVRQHTARLISLYAGPTIEGEAAETIMGLLSDENANVRRGTLRGISNTRVTPEIEARLVEIASDPASRQEVVYHGLSQLKDKSRVVVDALFQHLEDENHNVRNRAHWGLQRGVAKEQQYYVATQYAQRLDKIVTPKAHKEALQLIVRYGNDDLAPQLQHFAENEMVDEATRALARKAAEYLIEKKPAR